MRPLAYHLTWTTYGTWLHGDARGSIEKGKLGVLPPDPVREAEAREHMATEAVRLTPEQRELVGETVRDHCRIRGWLLHAVNPRSNHVHVVVTAGCGPQEAMSQFKAWTARRLSDQAGLCVAVARKAGRRRWWTEGGDPRPVWDERHLENAVRYVAELQGD